MTSKHEDAKTKYTSSQLEISELKRKNQKEISEFKKKNQKEISELKRDHQKEIIELKRNNALLQKEINSIKNKGEENQMQNMQGVQMPFGQPPSYFAPTPQINFTPSINLPSINIHVNSDDKNKI